MLTPKALTLALLGVDVKDQLAISSQSQISLAQMASKYLMMVGSPELYYLRKDIIDSNPTSFSEQGVVSEVEDITKIPIIVTSTATKDLPRHVIPSPAVDDPVLGWFWSVFPGVKFTAYFATLTEQLFISLFIVIYCVIIAPGHFIMSYFMDFEPIGDILDLLDLVSEYQYAIFFWFGVILNRPMKFFVKSFVGFVTFVRMRVHDTIDPEGELKNRLRRAESKVRGQSILLKNLGLAKDAHAAALTSQNDKITDIANRINDDFRQLAYRIHIADDRFYALEDFVNQQAAPIVIEFINKEIGRIADTFSHESKDIIYRIQSLESEVNGLKSSIKAKDDEIEALKTVFRDAQMDKVDTEALKTAVGDAQNEKASLEKFYRSQNFNNLSGNEYYQKVFGNTPAGQIAPLVMAYQTAVYMQVSSTTEMMRRISVGHPTTYQPVSRSQNSGSIMPSRYPFSNSSPSGFTPSGSPDVVYPPKTS